MMDITAMLNTSAESDGQSKLEDSLGDSFRTRTPWDAGGYSLPIHTHHHGPFTDYDLPNDSIKENQTDDRRHKSSDSHSSLSSFASSISISHSRFSSMSTVSSLQLPSQTISETILMDSETSSLSSKTATGSCSPTSPHTGRSTSQSSSSPALYGNGLALIAERHFNRFHQKESADQLFTVAESAKVYSNDSMEGHIDGRLSTISSRPASPSDAILIKRPTPPVIPYLTKKYLGIVKDSAETHVPGPDLRDIVPIGDQRPGRLLLQTRNHKRTVSAPEFPECMVNSPESIHNAPDSSNVNTDISLPSSPPRKSFTTTITSSAALTPPREVEETSQDRRPCCMYIANCDTGSQLRKAVSHIFGRNKMCTRRIPPHVWVWYCRKHYQRARYRNAKEWARTLQYDLVSRQIKRLQEWSEENSNTGEGGIVQDYRLAIRKREQRRLDAQKPKGEHECSDSEVEENSESQGDISSSTAVPDWLLSLSGRSHNAIKIMEIIDGIQADLTENNLSAWPDIEILPNIILQPDESETAKTHAKRKVLSSAHARSQSLGSAARLDENVAGLWASQERIPLADRKHSQKRKRSSDRGQENDVEMTPQSQRIRMNERQVAAVKQGPHTAQGPVFRNSRGNQNSEESFGNADVRLDYAELATRSHSIPLAAPTPQRYSSLATAAYIDPRVPSTEGNTKRPGLHKRSHSDMGNLYNSPMPSYLSARYRHHIPASVQNDKSTFRRILSPHALHASPSYIGSPIQHHRAHTRHQSTPPVPCSIPYPVSYSTSCPMLPRISSPLPSLDLDVADSVGALDLYNRRRQ